MKRNLAYLFFLFAFKFSIAQDLPYTIVPKSKIDELIKKAPVSTTSVAQTEDLFNKVHPEIPVSSGDIYDKTTDDGRFHIFKYYKNSLYWLEVFDAKTGINTQLLSTKYFLDYVLDPKGTFIAFSSNDTLRAINLQTMDLVYELDKLINVYARISPSGNHLLITYSDFMDRTAVMVIATSNWQLLTKINFFAYEKDFILGTNKFYINSYWREKTEYKTYDHYKFSTLWDIDKIEKLASENKLQLEYSAEEVSYIDKFTDVTRGISISPKGNYVMAGNVLYNSDATFIKQLPTPEKLGNSVTWKISDDDKYLKTFETKWRITSTEMINDTINTFELSLPDFNKVEGNKGTYSGYQDKALAEIAKTNPDIGKIINSGTNYNPYNYYGLFYSPTTKTIYSVKDIKKKSEMIGDKVGLGYFTGNKDDFKVLETFERTVKTHLNFFFNKTNDKVLVRIDREENKTAELQLWDLTSKKLIKKIPDLEYCYYYDAIDFKLFTNEDLSKFYTYRAERTDTLFELDINTEKEISIVLNSPTICMSGIQSVEFQNGIAWVTSKNEAACSLEKYDASTWKKLQGFQLPDALEQLEKNATGKKIRDNAWKAKDEAERVAKANKFDAKAYKAKLNQQKKEINSLVNQAVGEAASKKPVYETCPYCHGTGQIYNFNIAYTREVSGSWGYSSSYSNVTTTTRSYIKCTSCSGSGKSVCYKPSCYDINVGGIIQGVKNK